MKTESVGIAMSGGVDSTVSAVLLKNRGYEVHGFFMQLPLPDIASHIARLRRLTETLEIPLHIVDLSQSFTDTVIRYFVDTYQWGMTPNPCIFCNKNIKFGALLAFMQAKGMQKAATGHYARIQHNGFYRLVRGLDATKDQSYFLCRLDQDQLRHMILPLGEITKKEVYELAASMGVKGYNQQESQDVCFLAGKSVAECLKQHGIGERTGAIVTSGGQALGRHQGIWRYTIGQRRGLGLPDATPWYVTALDPVNDRVIVGKHEELFSRRIEVTDLLWTGESKPFPWQGAIQLRSRHRPQPGTVMQGTDEYHAIIVFDEPQRAVTPGQFAAFYEEEAVIGSGIIAPPSGTPKRTDC